MDITLVFGIVGTLALCGGVLSLVLAWRKTQAPPPPSLGAVLVKVQELESTVRLLRAEWLDCLQKFERLTGRIERARGWDAHKPGPVGNPVEPSPGSGLEPAEVVDDSPGAPGRDDGAALRAATGTRSRHRLLAGFQKGVRG